MPCGVLNFWCLLATAQDGPATFARLHACRVQPARPWLPGRAVHLVLQLVTYICVAALQPCSPGVPCDMLLRPCLTACAVPCRWTPPVGGAQAAGSTGGTVPRTTRQEHPLAPLCWLWQPARAALQGVRRLPRDAVLQRSVPGGPLGPAQAAVQHTGGKQRGQGRGEGEGGEAGQACLAAVVGTTWTRRCTDRSPLIGC